MIYLDTSAQDPVILEVAPPTLLPWERTVFFRQDIAEIANIQRIVSEYLAGRMAYNQVDCSGVFLLIDEMVANAIIYTFNNNPSFSREYLVARWKIDNRFFIFQVIDFALGLDIRKVTSEVPNPRSSDYFERVLEYQNSNTLRIMNNGQEVNHSRTGRGLGIIHEFSKAIHLRYFNYYWEYQKEIGEDTLGTIFCTVYPLVYPGFIAP